MTNLLRFLLTLLRVLALFAVKAGESGACVVGSGWRDSRGTFRWRQ